MLSASECQPPALMSAMGVSSRPATLMGVVAYDVVPSPSCSQHFVQNDLMFAILRLPF